MFPRLSLHNSMSSDLDLAQDKVILKYPSIMLSAYIKQTSSSDVVLKRECEKLFGQLELPLDVCIDVVTKYKSKNSTVIWYEYAADTQVKVSKHIQLQRMLALLIAQNDRQIKIQWDKFNGGWFDG